MRSVELGDGLEVVKRVSREVDVGEVRTFEGVKEALGWARGGRARWWSRGVCIWWRMRIGCCWSGVFGMGCRRRDE